MPFERPTSQNLRAGAGVCGVIVAAGLVVWLGLWLQSAGRVAYTVSFTPQQGVYGLRTGSLVRVGGLVKGEVTAVRPHVEADQVMAYMVDFSLSREVTLYRAARIVAVSEGIAGDSTLEITNVGRGRTLMGVQVAATRDARPAEPGEVFVAADPGEFDGLVGPGRSQKLRDLVAALQALRGPVTAMAEDAAERVPRARDAWRDLAEAVRADVDGWRDQWRALSERAEQATRALGLGADAPPDAFAPSLRALRDDLAGVDLERASARLQMARGTLARALETLDSVQAQGFAIRNALNDADEGLGDAAADYAIAGQELAATTREVVASPWRLLARPTSAEEAAARRTEEARIFAQAATEFEVAIAAIRQALVQDAAVLARSPALADLLSTRLGAATTAFDGAVGRFTEALIGPARTPARDPGQGAPPPEAGAPNPAADPGAPEAGAHPAGASPTGATPRS